MKYTISALLAFLLVGNVQAQIPDYVFLSNDFEKSGSNAVHIKWMSDSVFYPLGVDILRSENGGSWNKINSEPIRAMKALPTGLSQDEKVFGSLAITVPYADFIASEFQRAVILSEGLKSQKLARVLGITYVDNATKPGAQYAYRVLANHQGRSVTIGEASITVGPFKPIAQPDSFLIDRQKKQVNIRWKMDEPRFSYVKIQKSENGSDFTDLREDPIYIAQFENEDGTFTYPEVFIEDRGIKKEQDYWYRIAAYDYFGQIGQYSEALPATFRDMDPPPSPQNPEVTKSDSLLSIEVIWQYPDNVPDLKGFMLLSQSADMDTAVLVSPNLIAPSERSFTFNALSPGLYVLSVVALDQADNFRISEPRAVQLADKQAPVRPTGFEVRLDSGKVNLSWSPNTEPDFAGYWVFRGIDKGADTEFISLGGALVTTTEFQDILPKQVNGAFAYKIQAIDTNYNKSPYSEVIVASIKDQLPPVAPVITQIKNEEGMLTINFLASPDADLKEYQLIRVSAEDTVVMVVAKELLQYEDQTATPGKFYEYTLVAIDQDINRSDASNRYPITAKGQDMSVFDGYTPEKVEVKYSKSKERVDLNWSQAFGEGIIGVIVYKGEKENELTPITSPAKKPGYQDKRVEAGITYYYQLRTFASNGAKHISDIVSIKLKDEKK